MATVSIDETGCRGCTLCNDICPVDVFVFDEAEQIAKVNEQDDCIACLSCHYLCPSQCITLADYEQIRPFHWFEENIKLVERFLQTKPASTELTADELERAFGEVGMLLIGFSETITDILGRGHKSVGRRAGQLAAEHIPELYDEATLEALLGRMQRRFGASLDFDFTVEGGNVDMLIHPCGLLKHLECAGQKPNESDVCLLFHEYWAGLLSTYTGTKYAYNVPQAGATCMLQLRPQSAGG